MKPKANRSYICTGRSHPQAVVSLFLIQQAAMERYKDLWEVIFLHLKRWREVNFLHLKVEESVTYTSEPLAHWWLGWREHTMNQSASLCVEVRRCDWLSHTGRRSYRGGVGVSGMGKHNRPPDPPPRPMPTGRGVYLSGYAIKTFKKLCARLLGLAT